jgi:threonine aldolase
MREAMAQAEVGDDVYNEDPTVARLEEHVAEMFGVPAAVYVPSGTMGNQICLRLVCPPAGEVLCDADAHIVTYEGGGAAQHGAIQTRTIVSDRGLLDPAAVVGQLRPAGWGTVPTAALAVEQTHNRGGGAIYPLEQLAELGRLAHEAGAKFHCDGARIWNAHVATGVPLSSYMALFNTMSVCLSKGLGAPVGSLVLCTEDAAAEARVLKRRLGGGWRQAGILAAAGLHAVTHHVERLADDHARARRLAEMLSLDPAGVETNIVKIDVADAPALAASAKAEGVLVSVTSPTRIRLVTHLDVDDAGIEHAAKVVAPLLMN